LARTQGAELVELLTPLVELEVVRVPDTDRLCAAGGVVRFRLARAARVTLTAAGGEPAPVPLAAGVHELVITAPPRRGLALGERPFALEAIEPGAARAVTVSGTLREERLDRPALRVGRTFVSGVDLLDGHLVLQKSDLELVGRHLQLEVTRTYSSAGRSGAGAVAAGWRINQESSVTPVPQCGLAVVRTADGGYQTFLGSPGTSAQAFQPERGYHTRLRRTADGSFDFLDKASVRHHFSERAAGTATTLRLDWIEEPHGDRIVLEYESSGRLRAVSEWHPLLGPVRTLLFRYAAVGGAARIASIDAWGLGLRVVYRHDERGNLVAAERLDREKGVETDRYEYSTADTRDPHQLVTAVPHGAARTTYVYGHAATSAPAAEAGFDLREAVRVVQEAGAAAPTTFSYDWSRAESGELRVDVHAGPGGTTRYKLNEDGNPLRIDAPEGTGRVVTTMSWDRVHVVKSAERSSTGRSLRYGHDAAGNLTLHEDQERAGAPWVRTVYAYDPRFNKLVHKEAPDGLSSWSLDPRTGDLLRAALADGKVTSWAYDDSGCLAEEREAGGRTLYLRPDTFCNATEIHASDGGITRRRYDSRGALLDETKTKPESR
jgi:YD repeat-containing protein